MRHLKSMLNLLPQRFSCRTPRLNYEVNVALFWPKAQEVGKIRTSLYAVSYYHTTRSNSSGVNQSLGDNAVITVPIGLKNRLEKKKIRESKKFYIRAQQLEQSRAGNKSSIIIQSKYPSQNHYKGMTYDKRDALPLASKGWMSRKSKGDFFIIKPQEQDGVEKEINFEDLRLNETIVNALKEQGIIHPSPVQYFAIPELLKDTGNYILSAETGSGKTLAYLLPVFHSLLQDHYVASARKLPCHPKVVIIAPTRELCDQLYKVALKYSLVLNLKVKLLQGGSLAGKKSSVSKNPIDILVTTVYALNAMSDAGAYNFSQVQKIIVDEADTMLDDSFSPLLFQFLTRFEFSGSASSSKLVLVSATVPRSLDSILQDIIDVNKINRITTPGLHRAVPHVQQSFLRLRKMDKPNKCLEMISKDLQAKNPVMIFVAKTNTCKWMYSFLQQHGVNCIALNGEIPIAHRKQLFESYQNGEFDVLICTDLASRGLDTTRTKHVINYDFPIFIADYIHRCGRVGRLGSAQKCFVTNFISTKSEVSLVQEIETSIRKHRHFENINANIKRILNFRYGSLPEI